MSLRSSFAFLLAALWLCFVACDEDRSLPFDPVHGEEEPWYPPSQITPGMTRAGWQISSEPAHLDGDLVRTRMLWHNLIDGVPANHVYDADLRPGEGVINVFRMIYRPALGEPSWAGITKYIGPCVDVTRLKSFELRVRGTRGKLHFDFGRISDDIDGNLYANSEDVSGNGIYDYSEDTGLDGLVDYFEAGWDPLTNPDPSGDNWFFLGNGACPVPRDSCMIVEELQRSVHNDGNRDAVAYHYYYEWLNGTEGNKDDLAMGCRPDQEGSGWRFSTVNSYLSYTVDLSDDSLVVPGSEWEFPHYPGKPWRTIRIPILDTTAVDTAVGLSTVDPISLFGDGLTHVRVWFEGDGSTAMPDTVEIAAWYFDHEESTVPLTEQGQCPFLVNVVPNTTAYSVRRDYEYQEGRIFDLGYPGEFEPNDSVARLHVFEEITNIQGHEDETRYNCILTVNGDTASAPSYNEQRFMVRVEDDAYTWHRDASRNHHCVFFRSPAIPHRALAVYMEIVRGDGTTVTIGDLHQTYSDTVVLKMLRSGEGTYSPAHPTWSLMWRNVYDLPANSDVESLSIQVFMGLPGTETSPDNLDYQEFDGVNEGYYLEILGLDQVNNNTNQGIPDQKVDPTLAIYNPDWGLLIFPHKTPFASDTTFTNAHYQTEPLREHAESIYNYNTPTEKAGGSRYYLQYSHVARTNLYQLPCTNIKPYTEVVVLNGRRLNRDIDYRIDYVPGTILWMIPEAVDPQASLVVFFPPFPNGLWPDDE